ncbi:NmrA family protein [Astrocystis sublimbata]|nr:NmrA family protein [Astrocystis sublimbata]
MSAYLVTGATGQQGRAVVDALLERGLSVRVVVRDPTSAAARTLAQQNVELFKGTHDDFAVFRSAAQGCAGVFLNLVERPANPHPDQQAAGILAACKEASVKHVVVSTVGWGGSREKWDVPVNQASGLAAYYEGEYLLEAAVRKAGMEAYTILRPFWFHSNYVGPHVDFFHPDVRKSGELVHAYEPGTLFPHVNVGQLGTIAAEVLVNPAKYNGEEIEVATENLAIEEVVAILNRVTGQNIRLRKATPEEAAVPGPTFMWHQWANDTDLAVDVEAVRQKFGGSYISLEAYLNQVKEAQGLSYFP